MRAIDRPRYHATTLERLSALRTLDPMRSGYYTDLADKWSVEETLQKWIEAGSFQETIDLTKANLVTLNYDQYLCVADRIALGSSKLRPNAERKLVEIYAECGVTVDREIA